MLKKPYFSSSNRHFLPRVYIRNKKVGLPREKLDVLIAVACARVLSSRKDAHAASLLCGPPTPEEERRGQDVVRRGAENKAASQASISVAQPSPVGPDVSAPEFEAEGTGGDKQLMMTKKSKRSDCARAEDPDDDDLEQLEIVGDAE